MPDSDIFHNTPVQFDDNDLALLRAFHVRDEPHDDADYRAAVNAQHDDNDGPTTVAQLLDSYDHGYVNWDTLIDGIDRRVFESFTRICDAIEDHRARRARLSPAERAAFDARTKAG